MSDLLPWTKFDPENPPIDNRVFEVVYASSVEPYYMPGHAFYSRGAWFHRIGYIKIETPETVHYRLAPPVDLPAEVTALIEQHNDSVIEYYTKKDGSFHADTYPLANPHFTHHQM